MVTPLKPSEWSHLTRLQNGHFPFPIKTFGFSYISPVVKYKDLSEDVRHLKDAFGKKWIAVISTSAHSLQFKLPNYRNLKDNKIRKAEVIGERNRIS